jgi:mannose-6-phosphate isomerase-like protein (cupin superfamily)
METSTTKAYQISQFGPWSEMGRYQTGALPGKVFAREALGLTGCEVSLHRMPTGTGMPFLHAHRQNEEVYIVVSGEGTFHLDGQESAVSEGDMLRVSPSVARGFRAGTQDLCLICIQAKEGSLEQATREDGFLLEAKASWMA